MRVLRLTEHNRRKDFGAAARLRAAAERVRPRIVRDVRRRGDAALFYWTKRFDRVALQRKQRVGSDAMHCAVRRARVSAEFLEAVDHAARNIRAVARRQKPQEWSCKWSRACARASACGPSKRWDVISQAEDFRWFPRY